MLFSSDCYRMSQSIPCEIPKFRFKQKQKTKQNEQIYHVSQ